MRTKCENSNIVWEPKVESVLYGKRKNKAKEVSALKKTYTTQNVLEGTIVVLYMVPEISNQITKIRRAKSIINLVSLQKRDAMQTMKHL